MRGGRRFQETLRRQARYRRGWQAEWLAAGLLFFKGYRILNWRYRTSAGEIDLVAKRGRVIAFVEVKLRQSEDDALRAVTARQKARIFRAADLWMARRQAYQDYDRSFDLVAVVPWRSVKHHMQFFTW